MLSVAIIVLIILKFVSWLWRPQFNSIENTKVVE